MNEIKKVIKCITPELNVPNKTAKNNANAVAYNEVNARKGSGIFLERKSAYY